MKFELESHFELVVDKLGGGIREFVNDADRPAFLERELMGFGVDGSEFTTVKVTRCPFTHFESI